jgi:hypothetical protein
VCVCACVCVCVCVCVCPFQYCSVLTSTIVHQQEDHGLQYKLQVRNTVELVPFVKEDKPAWIDLKGKCGGMHLKRVFKAVHLKNKHEHAQHIPCGKLVAPFIAEGLPEDVDVSTDSSSRVLRKARSFHLVHGFVRLKPAPGKTHRCSFDVVSKCLSGYLSGKI